MRFLTILLFIYQISERLSVKVSTTFYFALLLKVGMLLLTALTLTLHSVIITINVHLYRRQAALCAFVS